MVQSLEKTFHSNEFFIKSYLFSITYLISHTQLLICLCLETSSAQMPVECYQTFFCLLTH